MSQATLAAAIAAWGLLCFALGRWCRSLAFVAVCAAPALAIVPHDVVLRERCDVLLYEHVYDDEGRKVFTQLCPLDWHPHHERWDYVCFRLENARCLRPERAWQRGGYVVRFIDGDLPREIWAPSMREEWVQADSEVAAREVLPKESRRGLSHPNGTR